MAGLTVFSDASHCPRTKAAGWGAWAKGDGWERGLTFGGPIKATVLNAAEAEMAAMANALVRLHNQGQMAGQQRVMLQSDCIRVLQLVLQAIPRAEPSNHKDGAPVTRQTILPSPTERRGIQIIVDVLQDCPTILLRHVRGHRPGEGRQWVNRVCDDIAGRHMREERTIRGGIPAPRKRKKRKKTA